jgi:hypothetical protein
VHCVLNMSPLKFCLTFSIYFFLLILIFFFKLCVPKKKNSCFLFYFFFFSILILDVVMSSKWAQCQFCKLIITSVNLWRHIRTQHTPQPPRNCEKCQKTFKNKYSLREHVRMAHEQKQTITLTTTP